MLKLWGIIFRDNRIITDYVAESENDSFEECMQTLCAKFDLEKPVLINKHETELEKFGRTSFIPDDFIDSVDFDMFSIEIIKDKKEKK